MDSLEEIGVSLGRFGGFGQSEGFVGCCGGVFVFFLVSTRPRRFNRWWLFSYVRDGAMTVVALCCKDDVLSASAKLKGAMPATHLEAASQETCCPVRSHISHIAAED